MKFHHIAPLEKSFRLLLKNLVSAPPEKNTSDVHGHHIRTWTKFRIPTPLMPGSKVKGKQMLEMHGR